MKIIFSENLKPMILGITFRQTQSLGFIWRDSKPLYCVRSI